MTALQAYFDGSAVRTVDAYQFRKNQKLIITVLDDTEAWAQAAREKQDIDRRLSLLAGLQKYRGRLPADFDAEKELAQARELKYTK